jgi:hypothetical protein
VEGQRAWSADVMLGGMRVEFVGPWTPIAPEEKVV